MDYLTYSEFTNMLQGELRSLLSNDDPDVDNQTLIEGYIIEAESLVNSHLALYDLTTVIAIKPPVLKRLTFQISKYYLYMRKFGNDVKAVAMPYQDYQDALKFLRDLKSGQVVLEGVDVSTTKAETVTGIFINSDTQRLNRDNIRNSNLKKGWWI